MTAPVALATVHHEGAGAPTDEARGAAGGYSAWIGPTRYTLLRPPSLSFATLHFNHVSFDVCFSGDRNVYPITDRELVLLRQAASDARSRGWVAAAPYVRPHRESPGSVTICPGNKCAYPDPPTFPDGDALAWVAIVTALHKETPPMPPKLAPEYFPALGIVSSCAFNLPTGGRAFAMLDATGAVFCEPASAYQGGANGKDYFAARTGARISPQPRGGYTITATSGETYNYPEH